MAAPNTALTRRAAISWFTTTQASKIVRDGAIPYWFHGIISRRDAEELLKDKSLGCFLIRVGESRIGFSLSYRGLDRCRHFIIDVTAGGQYNISGASNLHQTLQDLVTFHTRVPIVPFTECLTVPCGQKKQNSPTPHSCSSAGSSCPTTSHSASNNRTADLPKQAAISPPIPPKGHCSRLSPRPLPHRGMTDLKPVLEPKGMTDEPTLLSGRVVVKRLYPSLRMQPTTMSMEQQPTPGVTVSGPQSLLLQRNQHSNAEMGIRNLHISSGRDVSDSKSEFKHQANAAGNVYCRHPNPIPTQRQPADHMTDTNSLALALKYTDCSPSTRSRCDQLSPAPRSPLHPPRTAHGQSGSHSPALHSKIIQFIQAEPVRRCQPLTGYAEGEIREHESGRVDLPAEYMIPPPYAPGYQPSEKIEQKKLK